MESPNIILTEEQRSQMTWLRGQAHKAARVVEAAVDVQQAAEVALSNFLVNTISRAVGVKVGEVWEYVDDRGAEWKGQITELGCDDLSIDGVYAVISNTVKVYLVESHQRMKRQN